MRYRERGREREQVLQHKDGVYFKCTFITLFPIYFPSRRHSRSLYGTGSIDEENSLNPKAKPMPNAKRALRLNAVRKYTAGVLMQSKY